MLGSTFFFGLMVIAIRLASEQLHTLQVAFFRNVFGLVLLLMILGPRIKATLRSQHIPNYLLRSVIGFLSMFCSFWAIGHLPLAQAVSISYSSPIFVTIAAVLFLHETVRLRRWSAVIVGFIGVLVIIRPGSSDFSIGMLVALTGALLSAVVSIQIKQLSKLDSPDTIVLYTYLFWVAISLVPAIAVWQWPTALTWLWAILAGMLGTGGQLLWTRALKLGDVSALTPISFMQLPIVALAGWLLFGESIDRYTIIGAGIIFASNAYIAHRERVLARRAATHAPAEAAKTVE